MKENKIDIILNDTYSITLQVDKEKSNITNVCVVGQLKNKTDTSDKYEAVITLRCNSFNDSIEVDVVKSKISVNDVLGLLSAHWDKIIGVNLNNLINNYLNKSNSLPEDTKEFKIELNLPYPGKTEEYNLGVVREYVKNYLILENKFMSNWKCIRLNFEKINVKLSESTLNVIVEVKQVY